MFDIPKNIFAKTFFTLALISVGCESSEYKQKAEDDSPAVSSSPPPVVESHIFYFYLPSDVVKDIEKIYEKNNGSKIYEISFARFFDKSKQFSTIEATVRNKTAKTPETISYDLREDFLEKKKEYDKSSRQLKINVFTDKDIISLSDLSATDYAAIFKNAEKLIALIENKPISEIGVNHYHFSIGREIKDDLRFLISIGTENRLFLIGLDDKGNIKSFYMNDHADNNSGQIKIGDLKNLNKDDDFQ